MQNKAKKSFIFNRTRRRQVRQARASKLGAKTCRSTACRAPATANGRVPHAQGREHGTAHGRKACAVAACALEARALFCRGASAAKVCAAATPAESRAIGPDASRLNGVGLRCVGMVIQRDVAVLLSQCAGTFGPYLGIGSDWKVSKSSNRASRCRGARSSNRILNRGTLCGT